MYVHLHSLHPGLYIGSNEGDSPHQRWYYEARITGLPTSTAHTGFHLRVGWASPAHFQPRPSSNGILTTSGGVGDDLYSVSFDGEYFWFGGEPTRSSLELPQRKGVLKRQSSLSCSPVPPPADQLEEGSGQRGREGEDRQSSLSCSPVSPPGDQLEEGSGLGWREGEGSTLSCSPGDQLEEGSGLGGRVREGDVIGCYLDVERKEVWFSRNGCVVLGVLRLPHLDEVVTPAISMSSSVR